MVGTHRESQTRWVSLGGACALLGVNESTLRNWADSGRIRSFRTVGGHRRFAREDLARFTRTGERALPREGLGDAVLKRYRRRLQSPRNAPPQVEGLDDEGRARLRDVGRRLVELALLYHRDRRRRVRLLEDARSIGDEYAAEFTRAGIDLTTAVQAFVFHRSTCITTVRGIVGPSVRPAAGDEVTDLWQGIVELTDAVLLSIVRSYATAAAAETPELVEAGVG